MAKMPMQQDTSKKCILVDMTGTSYGGFLGRLYYDGNNDLLHIDLRYTPALTRSTGVTVTTISELAGKSTGGGALATYATGAVANVINIGIGAQGQIIFTPNNDSGAGYYKANGTMILS